MIEDAVGNALHVGRKKRTIPASTKRALLRRDRTCRFPGCCNRVFLDGHHAKHWAEGLTPFLVTPSAKSNPHRQLLVPKT
jgi:hypothetical protein